MKILIIGGMGAFGSAVANDLAKENEVIVAGFEKGPLTVDIACHQSLTTLFDKVGMVDAIVSIASYHVTSPVNEASCLNHTWDQTNIIRAGLPFLRKGGSITLTTGNNLESTRNQELISRLNGFVKTVSIEVMDRGKRINAVAPSNLGYESLKFHDASLSYKESIFSGKTGEIIKESTRESDKVIPFLGKVGYA